MVGYRTRYTTRTLHGPAIYLPTYLSIYLSIYPSIYPGARPPVHRSQGAGGLPLWRRSWLKVDLTVASTTTAPHVSLRASPGAYLLTYLFTNPLTDQWTYLAYQ